MLKLDPKNTELVAQKQTILTQSIEETSEKLRVLKEVQKQTDEAIANGTKVSDENYRNLQREIINTQNKINNLTEELKQFNIENSNWTKAGKKIEEYGNKIKKVSDKVDNLGNKVSIASAGAVAVGTATVKSAMSIEDAVAKLTASTDIAAEETEEYKKILEEINNDGYGDGFEDIADSMSQVKTQLKDLNTTDLKNVTEQAIALRDLYGYEVSESIRSVKALMDNFKISAEDAFDFIAQGKKEGLDFSNELLDNINEYSVQFGKLGLSAQDMFNIFKAGSENGAFNLDKIGDAVKEFSIRAIDGSNTTIDGFKRLGLNADKMAEKFASGGETAREAFFEVIAKIRDMDDEVEQSIVGVDLFGTMWEDLGPTVITSFDKINSGIEQGSGTMQDSMNSLYNSTQKKAQKTLKKITSLGAKFGDKMLPVIDKLIDKADKFVDSLDNLSDGQKENIVKMGLMVAAAGPLIKISSSALTVLGKVTTGIGKVSKAIGVASGKMQTSETSVKNLAKVFEGLATPVGVAATLITASVAIIVSEIKKAEEETKEKFSTMGQAASDFYEGIQTAEGYLDTFNTTLFASTEEQENLQKQMDEIQSGITEICKTASDERRGYTQEEITQLDEYFEKLRELKDKEIAIQQEIAGAITQQATTTAETFQGSLEEYQVQSQEWIATAQQQADETIDIIEEQSIEEVALLNQRYGDQANMQNEAYANEYNKIMENKQTKIDAANAEVAEITSIFAQGYAQRANQDGDFYEHIQHYNWEQEQEANKHNANIESIQNSALLTTHNKNMSISNENYRHEEEQKKIWKNMYKNMSESEAQQLGCWLGMLANTEMYGGEISEENRKMVDFILDSYDEMTPEAKKAMEGTMQEMLGAMKSAQPTLFSRASSIAGGILNRLKTSFNIDTSTLPGHKSGLDYVPYDNYIARLHKGERVLTAEENKQLMKMEKASKIGNKFSGVSDKIRQIDSQKIVFTTPNITFNVQKMDEANLDMAFNYINRKFGSRY